MRNACVVFIYLVLSASSLKEGGSLLPVATHPQAEHRGARELACLFHQLVCLGQRPRHICCDRPRLGAFRLSDNGMDLMVEPKYPFLPQRESQLQKSSAS